ncbi:PepSY domain-containing protein, partial [Vibrio furnissii]
IALSGIVMWWIRRPVGKGKLGVPPRFAQAGIWKVGLVTLVVIGVAFPLAGATIVTVLLCDWLLFSRVEKLRNALQ